MGVVIKAVYYCFDLTVLEKRSFANMIQYRICQFKQTIEQVLFSIFDSFSSEPYITTSGNIISFRIINYENTVFKKIPPKMYLISRCNQIILTPEKTYKPRKYFFTSLKLYCSINWNEKMNIFLYSFLFYRIC